MKARVTVFCLIAISFTCVSYIYSQDKIVEGASEFLIERANDNFIYIFEQKIKDNKILKIYLPRTYLTISSANIQTLLTNSRVWRECVTTDIDTLYSQVWTNLGRGASIFPRNMLDALEQYLPSLQEAKLKYGDKIYSINSVGLDDPKEVKSIVNNITITYDDLLNLFNKIKTELSVNRNTLIENLALQKSNKARLPVLADINKVLRLIDNYNNLLNAKNYSIINKESLLFQIEKIKPFLNDANDVITSAQILADTSYSFSYRIINSFVIVNYLIKRTEDVTGDSLISSEDYKNYFDKFKQYSLFFAQLSDANSVEQVKDILKAATIPSISFALKRNNGEIHFEVSSYLGFNLGTEWTGGFKQKYFTSGLSAPVGLEFSYGIGNNNSLGIMFSILDFGPPINSRLYNSKLEYQLIDLIQPGVYLTFGIKDLPLAIAAGYYNGKGYNINSQNVNHFNIAFLFDMPLFLIF
ncbi:MAG: hypothetical protein ACYC6P_11115 [Ignavibacteriaceae bacterium]